MSSKPKFAPREIFEHVLEWAVIPTFDLLVEYGDEGIVMLNRRIEPYKNVWALPGLRMYKGESIDDTLRRIALQELGIEANVSQKKFVAQYVGRFKTEHNRQDISTCYSIKFSSDEKLSPNAEHFSGMKIVKKQIPKNSGAMYREYVSTFLDSKKA